MVKVGVIGYGYWGPNLVRNFTSQKFGTLVAVAESNIQRHEVIKKQQPTVNLFIDALDLILSSEVDAVVIATPVFTHYKFAKLALENGKHVLLEKPMTSTVAESLELINLAEQKNLTLMVDHTFLYTGAVDRIKSFVDSGEIGKLQYFDSTRINLGLFQPDINVLWDLAPHDISILNYITDNKPYSVNATGVSHTNNGVENVAYMTINYESNFIAHFNCSWTSPVKVRSTLIGGDKKIIHYNDLEPSEKVRLYDTGYEHKTMQDRNSILVDYRVGDVYIPKLSSQEALFGVANDFLTSITNVTQPRANATLGMEVVKILEASQESIKNHGKEVRI
jgi:predicted dehydrogenase